jgi:hypothetical protein
MPKVRVQENKKLFSISGTDPLLQPISTAPTFRFITTTS